MDNSADAGIFIADYFGGEVFVMAHYIFFYQKEDFDIFEI
jgi:hypothetical protein